MKIQTYNLDSYIYLVFKMPFVYDRNAATVYTCIVYRIQRQKRLLALQREIRFVYHVICSGLQ